ncbi:NADH-quinone oxidoreductase subunit C [Streptomyces sp. NPDC048659]|uniref:NADH-quinone oxidoreductase subunit C n=1 Tax=Streptomyces sp. NPDC048659 TaxID=3155489 RepID=UPI00342A2707
MTLNQNAFDTLPDAVTDLFGAEATAERAYDLLTVDVPTASWIAALEIARDKLGCTYFDWLSAVDEPGTGFRVCAHVASVGPGHVRRLLLRTTVPHAAPSLPTAVAVYAGAGWHERETYEMFGVTFTDHPHLVHLLLPENFEGHPLRKDFVLAARVAKAWPGAKEPGEAHDPNAPKRRQMLPPGVPDPNEWGPLKGQLPPAPARPSRAAAGDRPARRARTTTEGSATQPTPATTPDPPTPPRRSRSASDGSASQATPAPAPAADPSAPVRRSRSASDGSASQSAPAPAPAADPSAPVRRSRSASDGSASQSAPTPAPAADPSAPVRRSRSASDGSASQSAPTPAPAPAADPSAPVRRSRSASAGSASQRAAEAATDAAAGQPDGAEAPQKPAPRTRSADAPWHHARPAFDEDQAPEAPEDPDKPAAPEPADKPAGTDDTDPAGGDPA